MARYDSGNQKTKRERRQEERRKVKQIKLIVFICITVLLAVSFIFTEKIEGLLNPVVESNTTESVELSQIGDDGLKIHYLAVGQGDCTVIEFPDDKIMVIDAGISKSADIIINYINDMVLDEGETKIDYFLITHSDADHIGSAVDLLNAFDIEYIFRPNIYTEKEKEDNPELTDVMVSKTVMWKNTVEAINAETDAEKIIFNYDYVISGQEILSNDSTDNALDYEVKFYYPWTIKCADNVNDFSPIFIVSYKGADFMFTGDSSSEVEEEFMARYATEIAKGEFDVEVLKLGHHGSKHSTSAEFLDAVTPEEAIVSCGEGNSYGHPHNEVIDRLAEEQIGIRRTDTDGTILYYVSPLGKISAVGNAYTPKTYYIHWWYIAASIFVVSFCFCILGKRVKIKT